MKRLSIATIGAHEYRKAVHGRRGHYAGNPAGGTPEGCRQCAGYAGAQAALSLRIVSEGITHQRSEDFLNRYADDAVMYAQQALRAWRSYRSFGKDFRP